MKINLENSTIFAPAFMISLTKFKMLGRLEICWKQCAEKKCRWINFIMR